MSVDKVVIEDYRGEVDPTILIPTMWSSYKEIPELQEVVHLLERWQYQSALKLLDHMIAQEVQWEDAMLLKGELLALYEANHAAIEVYQTLLQRNAENCYALTMLLIQMQIVHSDKEEMAVYLDTLGHIAPKLRNRVVDVFHFIEENQNNWNRLVGKEPLDLICVFGYFLHNDGSMPVTLETRLRQAYEMALNHPQAMVLLSGGAVQNTYNEAREMKRYLEAAGISASRLVALEEAKDTVGNVCEFVSYIQPRDVQNICIVTSGEHLSRAWMSLSMGLQQVAYDAEVFAVAPNEAIDPLILESEHKLSYQTVFRIAGLFEKKDIQRLL